MKPRLRLNRLGLWECESRIAKMYGVTPQDAYEEWDYLMKITTVPLAITIIVGILSLATYAIVNIN